MKSLFLIGLTWIALSVETTLAVEPASQKERSPAIVYVTDYRTESAEYFSLHRKVAELGDADKENTALLRKWLDSKKWLNGRKNSLPGIRSLASIAFAVDGDSGYCLTLLEDKETIVIQSGVFLKGRFRQRREGDFYSYVDEEAGAVLFRIFSKHYPSCVAVAAEFDQIQRELLELEDKEKSKKAKEASVGEKMQKAPM